MEISNRSGDYDERPSCRGVFSAGVDSEYQYLRSNRDGCATCKSWRVIHREVDQSVNWRKRLVGIIREHGISIGIAFAMLFISLFVGSG